MDAGDILPPLNKRKRLDDIPPDDEPVTAPTRSSEFWFDDGSIVLQVKKTQFRVHRSILSSNSIVFRDMLALPQPANEPTVEGCSVVVCRGDATVDWENLLVFLYEPARLQTKYINLPVSLLSSMLRLGQKYQFDSIRKNAFSNLKAHVPVSLGAWDTKFNPFHTYDDCVSAEEAEAIPWLVGREFEVVNIALEHGIQTLLPVAYYLCAIAKPMSEILNGSRSVEDKNTTIRLPSEAKNVVISGREKLINLAAKNAAEICSPKSIPCGECDSTQKCTEEFQRLTHFFLPRVGFADRCRFVLNFWKSIRIYFTFCPSCSEFLYNAHEDTREESWERLPLLFDLPGWEDLKDFDD